MKFPNRFQREELAKEAERQFEFYNELCRHGLVIDEPCVECAQERLAEDCMDDVRAELYAESCSPIGATCPHAVDIDETCEECIQEAKEGLR